jgi:hypothetical protein
MLTRLRSPDETPVISYDFCLCDDGQLPSFDLEGLYVLGLPFGHHQTEFVLIQGRNHENVSCVQVTLYQGTFCQMIEHCVKCCTEELLKTVCFT